MKIQNIKKFITCQSGNIFVFYLILCMHLSCYVRYVLYETRARVLYQHIKKPTASFLHDFKNDQSYELIDDEILKIHEV